MVEEQMDPFFDGRRHAEIGVVVGFLLTIDLDDGLQDGAEDFLNHQRSLSRPTTPPIRQYGAFSYKFAGNACTNGDQSPVV
ncbi:hypothetical protein [Paenibacillus sp. PL91]|uniref:hypothetical protein n=1 Tax=Paenibacillus sp. PL91 TaxID=2729538 RepID=UPI00145FA269|nr:hypothetical protein [Paenibacillus sp. PL91]MBC9203559.1 hypothetical protein [Paenibacillus sp. PL91]